ncbi:hypothetical protein CYMTET_53853 [Cymbomonas tetramitiformis]|uniref:Uncharacterized protein n=1 Tax=Cymbomonas tetramitiformis TaxID=36881 RepID=A0AAE0BHA5_9CHLO|nr:hypothetical protein CYMTET_53853 [Cymbomonas tetramitiformis]
MDDDVLDTRCEVAHGLDTSMADVDGAVEVHRDGGADVDVETASPSCDEMVACIDVLLRSPSVSEHTSMLRYIREHVLTTLSAPAQLHPPVDTAVTELEEEPASEMVVEDEVDLSRDPSSREASDESDSSFEGEEEGDKHRMWVMNA